MLPALIAALVRRATTVRGIRVIRIAALVATLISIRMRARSAARGIADGSAEDALPDAPLARAVAGTGAGAYMPRPP